MKNADGSIAGLPANIRVFSEGDRYVVANGSGWVEGEFDTVEAAVRAATRSPSVRFTMRDGAKPGRIIRDPSTVRPS